MNQGPWSVAGNDDYIVMAGEFTKVNNKAQQGLVRFPKKELSPNAQGPTLFSTTYPLNVSSTEAGKVRINWGTNHDIDNDNLTYRVYRDVQLKSGLVYETQARANFWAPYTMGFTDSGRRAGLDPPVPGRGDRPVRQHRQLPVDVGHRGGHGCGQQVREGGLREPADQLLAAWRDHRHDRAADRVGFTPATTGAGVTKGGAGAIVGRRRQVRDVQRR